MLIDRKIGGFMPNKPKKEEDYIQEDFYCEMCGSVLPKKRLSWMKS